MITKRIHYYKERSCNIQNEKKITYQNKDLNASQIPLLSKPMLSTVEQIENITDVHFSKVLYNVFRHVSTL